MWHSEGEITKISNYSFKKIVKEKIQVQVLSYLVTLQNKHTKSCSLCEDPNSEETESHLLSCPFLLQDKNFGEELSQVKFCDVFGDILEQKKAAEIFSKIMSKYDKNKNKKDKPGVS